MSQKKDQSDKSDRRSDSRERATLEFSKYIPLEESDTSESERLPTPPEEKPAAEGMVPSTSAGAVNPTGVGTAMKPSLSWTDTSCKTLSVTDSKGIRRSQSTDKDTFKPSFNPAGASKASVRKKSPLKVFMGRRRSPSQPRSESKSPLKKLQQKQTRARKVEEKKCLLDHPDGDKKVALKTKPSPVEYKYDGPKLTNEDLRVPQRDASDDDSTSKSSVSEASSVSRATRDLNIDRDDDESKEPQATGMTLRSSVSARVILPPESREDSDKESISSENSDEETKSKRKKK